MSTGMRLVGGGDIEEGTITGHVADLERSISTIEAPVEQNVDGGDVNMHGDDTEKWVISLESMLENIPRHMCNPGHPGRIGRIPENLREVDIKAYEPCYMSIGPYHHGKLSLQHMEKRKWVVLKCFLNQNPELTLKDILKEFESIEPAARSFYTDIKMDSEKFVQMLLLDSLYVVVMFSGMPKSNERVDRENRRNWSIIDGEENNHGVIQTVEGRSLMDNNSEATQIIERADQSTIETNGTNNKNGAPWFWTLLVHDLFLLENQLPFFALQMMHNLAYGGPGAQLIVNIRSMFQDLLFGYSKLDSEMVISQTEEVHLLLHLCHMFFRPTVHQDSPNEPPESSPMFRLGSAVQLHEAGVSFEAKSGSTPHSLLDITFTRSGKMVMPCLHVDDNTSSILRNLIVF